MENSEDEMTTVHCEMPHCTRNKDGKCTAEIVELIFGMVIKLAGRGAEGFQRCMQHQTITDIEEQKK